MKPVIITWVDSKGVTTGWEFKDDLQPLLPSHCTTVGFLIDDAKGYKTVCQSFGNDQIIGRMTIPSCAIIKMKILK